MDNAPYHHKRAFLSFSAVKNKPHLIEELLKAGLTSITIPAKEGVVGRENDTEIDLSKKYTVSRPNKPDDTDGEMSVADARVAEKFYYADRVGKKDPLIPTMEQLKEYALVKMQKLKEMKNNGEEGGVDLLSCEVQLYLASKGHMWIWTPAYTPWLQPIETFWGVRAIHIVRYAILQCACCRCCCCSAGWQELCGCTQHQQTHYAGMY